jgi:hypothetical protein
MKSSTRDAPPDGVPAGQAAGDVPTAGNARTRIARLARYTAEIVAEILMGFPVC